MTTRPQLSFVVPLFNHVEQTQDMLATLMASLPPSLAYEVVLVDDASTDGTRAWLAGLNDPRISVALNPHNCGYAKANNVGVAKAKAKIVGLLNNDLLFVPGWFEPMLAALESPTLNAGIVGNFQYRVSDKELDHAGVMLTPRGQFDHVRDEPNSGQDALAVFATTGACMFIRKADFDSVGGFDESFVNGCEDIDLCLKMRALGKHIYVATKSRIQHHVSLSRSRVSVQNEKNSQYLYAKWRKDIKLELTKTWICKLASQVTIYAPYIHGELSPSFEGKPHLAAMSIAEAALLREEARWARELGTADVNGPWSKHVRVEGLLPIPKRNNYLAMAELNVFIDHLKTARNFYVCGWLLEDFDPAKFAMTLSVNGNQKQICHLESGRNINLGIIDPLIIPSRVNHFKVCFYFLDDTGNLGEQANNVVLLSHLVVDDQVTKNFAFGEEK